MSAMDRSPGSRGTNECQRYSRRGEGGQGAAEDFAEDSSDLSLVMDRIFMPWPYREPSASRRSCSLTRLLSLTPKQTRSLDWSGLMLRISTHGRVDRRSRTASGQPTQVMFGTAMVTVATTGWMGRSFGFGPQPTMASPSKPASGRSRDRRMRRSSTEGRAAHRTDSEASVSIIGDRSPTRWLSERSEQPGHGPREQGSGGLSVFLVLLGALRLT
jgi:hypothetical protein